MTKRRRRLRRILWAGLLAVVALVVGIGLLVLSRDSAPLDDAHLLPRPDPPLAPEDDAFTALLEVARGIEDPDAVEAVLISLEDSEDPPTEEDWMRAREFVRRHEKIVERVDVALARSGYRVPRLLFGDDVRIDWADPLTTLSELLLVRCLVGDHDEQSASAQRDILRFLRWHHLTMREPAGVGEYFVGLFALTRGTRVVPSLLRLDPPEEDLQVLLQALPRGDTLRTAAERVFRHDYRWSKQALEWLVEEAETGDDGSWIPVRFRFKPNRTLRRMGAGLTQAIDQLSRPQRDRQRTRRVTFWDQFRRVGAGNALGDLFINHTRLSYEGIFHRLARAEARLVLTRALIALEIFERRHGRWPERLEEMVPEILDAVPRDPYDGEPLRYSAEHGWVAVLGEEASPPLDLSDPDPEGMVLRVGDPAGAGWKP